VKEEGLARLILGGEASLRHALTQYVTHLHHERHHQGKSNVLLLPIVRQDKERQGPIQCRERLGGLLQYSTVKPHEFFVTCCKTTTPLSAEERP
jgi:putative transposase